MINVWSYLEEYEDEKDEIGEAINEVLSSGKLILGPQVASFEEEFSLWNGQNNYGVGVGNGTDALFLACKALGLESGDEVITVANTAVPTVSAITACGAIPVFVDIHQDTYLMNVSQVESKITNKTKGIIPVHLFGQTVEMGSLLKIAKGHNLWVVEDCAQAHGALYNGIKAGTMGDIAAFSFYPTKILGTYGDGGLCLTRSPELRNRLRELRFYGMKEQYYSLGQGYNSRLDELHAAILRKKLMRLDSYIQKRKHIANIYKERLSGSIYQLPTTSSGNEHSYYLYVVANTNREKILAELKKKNINLNISYPWPIHLMSGFKHLGYGSGSLPNTERAASEIFSLPMYPSLSTEIQEIVIEELLTLKL
jgi:aminotransferase EvaB